MSHDSIVGIPTGYGLDGPGIESWGRGIFCTYADWHWGPPSLLHNGYWVFPSVKQLGCGIDHPPPSSSKAKERVELYIHSPSVPQWPVLGWTLPLPFNHLRWAIHQKIKHIRYSTPMIMCLKGLTVFAQLYGSYFCHTVSSQDIHSACMKHTLRYHPFHFKNLMVIVLCWDLKVCFTECNCFMSFI